MQPTTPNRSKSTFLTSPPTSSPSIVNAKQRMFGRGRNIVRDGVEAGLWYDFRARSIDSPDIIAWPLREDGTKFLPEELPEAFSIFKIPEPYCLCITQQTNGPLNPYFKQWIRVCSTDGDFYGLVITGCRRVKRGCGQFISLQELYEKPELACQLYERRTVPHINLLNFKDPEITLTETLNPQLSLSTPTPTPTSIPIPNPIVLSQEVDCKVDVDDVDDVDDHVVDVEDHVVDVDDASSSGSTNGTDRSSKRKRDAEPLKTDLAFNTSPVVSGPRIEKKKKAPKNPWRPGRQYNPFDLTDETGGENIEVKHQLTIASTDKNDKPEQPFYYHREYPPSERFFGDTYPLANPVDRSLLGIRNSDIPFPPERLGAQYRRALGENGVSADVFWILVDRCNCGLFFWKDYLHQVHGPRCSKWMRFMADRRHFHLMLSQP